MKKVLFATTALIATAGMAAADGHSSVTVGGWGYAGIFDNGTDTDAVSGVRFTFKGSVETDNGISLTASARMTTLDNAETPTALSRGKVTIASQGLSVAVGATNGAMRSLARTATFYGFNDGGTFAVDNSAGAITRVSDAGNNVYASYTTGGLTFGISSDVAGNTTEFGVKYAFDAWTVGLAANDDDDWMLSVKYNSDTIDVGLGFNSEDVSVLTLSYDVSPMLEISAAFGDYDGTSRAGLQVAYDLGGASLIGAVGDVDGGASTASLGVVFSF